MPDVAYEQVGGRDVTNFGEATYHRESLWRRRPEDCGCRTPVGKRLSEERVFKCRRLVCTNEAKACGGYCSECFARIMGKPHRPEVVVLCGSSRFYDEYQQANYDLTMAGKIVLSIGFYPHAKATCGHGEGVGHDSAEKAALDELHKRKIDMADRVFVLNVGGYIGDSTRSEIEYAEWFEKPIDYLVAPAIPSNHGEGE